MLLHTIVPFEAIFGSPGQAGALPSDTASPAGRECRVPGGLLELDGNGRVSRLISTDPRLYLDPRYAPGAGVAPDSGKS